MESIKIKKVLAILLVVLFLVTVTAGAVNAAAGKTGAVGYSKPTVESGNLLKNEKTSGLKSPATPYFRISGVKFWFKKTNNY